MNSDMFSFFGRKDAGNLSDFMRKNSSSGALKVQASLANGAVPIEGVDVVIYKDFDDGRWVFFTGRTDSSGIIDNISLPAPPYAAPTLSDVAGPHASYVMRAEKNGYEALVRQFDVYSGIRTVQPVNLRIAGGN